MLTTETIFRSNPTRSGFYSVSATELDTYLVPKKPIDVKPDLLHETGRGIACTRSAFVYLFRRTE